MGKWIAKILRSFSDWVVGEVWRIVLIPVGAFLLVVWAFLKKSSWLYFGAGAVAGVLALFAVGSCLILLERRRQRQEAVSVHGKSGMLDFMREIEERNTVLRLLAEIASYIQNTMIRFGRLEKRFKEHVAASSVTRPNRPRRTATKVARWVLDVAEVLRRKADSFSYQSAKLSSLRTEQAKFLAEGKTFSVRSQKNRAHLIQLNRERAVVLNEAGVKGAEVVSACRQMFEKRRAFSAEIDAAINDLDTVLLGLDLALKTMSGWALSEISALDQAMRSISDTSAPLPEGA